MKKLRLLWMIALASLFLGVSAQNADKKWAIGFNGVRSIYAGDLGDTFFNFDDQLNIGGGLTVNRYLSRFFNLSLYGSWSKLGGGRYGEDARPTYRQWYMGPIDENGRREVNTTNFQTSSLFNANLQLHYKFLGNDNHRIVPYLVFSGGAVGYDNLRTTFSDRVIKYHQVSWSNEHGTMIPDPVGSDLEGGDNPAFAITFGSGMGFDIRLSRSISLRYQFDAMWTDHENRDFFVGEKGNDDAWNNDWQFQHTLGFVWSFGGKKQEEIVVVEEPVVVLVDSDGDGVTDDIDQCPDTPRGCRVDAVGCSLDEDGDGVCDGLDRCPGTPAGVQVDASGCPVDTDGDGVPDYLDKCPTERGPASNHGCPVEEVKIQPAIVYFATNLYNLTAESIKTLDAMVATLQANPGVDVKIEGHTDNTGTTEFNRALANSRANAVKQYLTRKGIDTKRIVSTEGFWYSRPAADNSTVEGRAKNRRTEVIVVQ